jgi:hypothetical protein
LPDIEWNSAAHLVTGAKLGAARRLFDREHQEDLVGRAPITTKQFVDDFKGSV